MRDPSGTLLSGICTCTKRLTVQAAGEFVYEPHHRAWVFTGEDAPRRALSWRARYYLEDGEDHTGEPYRWHCCPFCGSSLPNTHDLPTTIWPPSGEDGTE